MEYNATFFGKAMKMSSFSPEKQMMISNYEACLQARTMSNDIKSNRDERKESTCKWSCCSLALPLITSTQ